MTFWLNITKSNYLFLNETCNINDESFTIRSILSIQKNHGDFKPVFYSQIKYNKD